MVLGGIYFTRTGHAPAGQPPLVEINGAALSALQAEFNRTSDKSARHSVALSDLTDLSAGGLRSRDDFEESPRKLGGGVRGVGADSPDRLEERNSG